MASQMSMIYQFPPIKLLPCAADAAGRTSSVYVNMRNCLKAWMICEVNQGNAATVQFTPLQGTSDSGAGSKAIGGSDTTAQIWLNDDTSLATGSDLFVAQAAALNFTTDATTKDKLIVFEIVPEAHLDLVNGFNHIGVSTGASNAANITSVSLHMWMSFQGASAPTSYV